MLETQSDHDQAAVTGIKPSVSCNVQAICPYVACAG